MKNIFVILASFTKVVSLRSKNDRWLPLEVEDKIAAHFAEKGYWRALQEKTLSEDVSELSFLASIYTYVRIKSMCKYFFAIKTKGRESCAGALFDFGTIYFKIICLLERSHIAPTLFYSSPEHWSSQVLVTSQTWDQVEH